MLGLTGNHVGRHVADCESFSVVNQDKNAAKSHKEDNNEADGEPELRQIRTRILKIGFLSIYRNTCGVSILLFASEII